LVRPPPAASGAAKLDFLAESRSPGRARADPIPPRSLSQSPGQKPGKLGLCPAGMAWRI